MHVTCKIVYMKAASRRVNVTLDAEHAAKLKQLAERNYVQEGTMARSLLCEALDQGELDGEAVTRILDATPGAWDSVQRGLADVAAGRTIPLEKL